MRKNFLKIIEVSDLACQEFPRKDSCVDQDELENDNLEWRDYKIYNSKRKWGLINKNCAGCVHFGAVTLLRVDLLNVI